MSAMLPEGCVPEVDRGCLPPSQYSIEQIRAYRALEHAAFQIGHTNLKNGLYKPKRGGYSITQEHKDVIEAMSAVLAGTMTVEAAFALVTSYEVMKQRFGT